MKASFIGNFEDPGFEGLVSVSLKLKKFLEGKSYKIDFNNFECDILHIHSNGFLEAKKNKKYGNKCIYSLYSNLNQSFIGTLRYYLEYLLFYYDGKNKDFKIFVVLKNALFSLISSLIPLSIKRNYFLKMKKVILSNDYISQKLKLENSEVIKFGIDTKKFRAIKIVNNEKASNKLVVAYFGHNTPLKGIPDFLGASKLLKNKNIEFRLYISNYSPRIKKLIKKYNTNVKVYGFVKDIVKEYNECDIIVLPYRSDVASIGVPLVLIEAMACEKAIITTNLEYIKEVIENTGICVDTYNPKQIALNILKLRNDRSLIENLGKIARERVVHKYNQNIMFDAYKKLYEDFTSNSLKFRQK